MNEKEGDQDFALRGMIASTRAEVFREWVNSKRSQQLITDYFKALAPTTKKVKELPKLPKPAKPLKSENVISNYFNIVQSASNAVSGDEEDIDKSSCKVRSKEAQKTEANRLVNDHSNYFIVDSEIWDPNESFSEFTILDGGPVAYIEGCFCVHCFEKRRVARG